jgi:hypothetical protein
MILIACVFLVALWALRVWAFGLSNDMGEIWAHNTHCARGFPMCKACTESRVLCNRCQHWYPTDEIARVLMSGGVCKKCEGR